VRGGGRWEGRRDRENRKGGRETARGGGTTLSTPIRGGEGVEAGRVRGRERKQLKLEGKGETELGG
jgi:hypothetical protein